MNIYLTFSYKTTLYKIVVEIAYKPLSAYFYNYYSVAEKKAFHCGFK